MDLVSFLEFNLILLDNELSFTIYSFLFRNFIVTYYTCGKFGWLFLEQNECEEISNKFFSTDPKEIY